MPKLRIRGGTGRILIVGKRSGAAPFDQAATLVKALGPGGGTTPTTATLTGISFASAGTVRAGAAVGTVLGTLSVSSTGVAPAGVAFALVTGAPLDVRVVGNQVQVNSGSIAAGDLSFQVDASATNGSTIRRSVTVTISAAASTGPATPVGALSVPFRVKAVADMPAGSPVSWFQPFAAGDVLPGERIIVETASGGAVQSQQDQEVSWPQSMAVASERGSLRGAAISILTPAAISAGQVVEFRVRKAAGAPNRAGHVSLASVRSGSDVHLKLWGLDLGGDEMYLGFNAITGAFPEANAGNGFSYGTNPAGGWETIRSGPLCCEWLAWGFTGRADGARHRWQKGQLYLRVWSNGAREITPVLSQPNAYGPAPGGSVGPTMQGRIACYAELRDGGTSLFSYTGPGASSAFTVPTSVFATGATGTPGNSNYLKLLDNCDQHWGMGSALVLSGALPTGFSAGTVIYPYDFGSDIYVAFTPNRGHALYADRSSQIAYTNAPATGTVTISTATQTFPGCAAVMMTPDVHPVWTGGAGRPSYLVAHDETYLTRRTKTIPPYDLTVSRDISDNGVPLVRSFQNDMTEDMRLMDRTSDAFEIDKIGYMTNTQSNLVVFPFDRPRDHKARAGAVQWANYFIWWDDERSGRPVAANNGPNRNGGQYPGLGPCNPRFRLYIGPGDAGGDPVWGGWRSWSRDKTDGQHPGYNSEYQVPVHGSHMPDFSMMPYLRTGHHVYAMIGLASAHAVHSSADDRIHTIGGRTYYGASLDSGRAQGRRLRSVGGVECYLPDVHPSRAMFRDILDDWADWLTAYTATNPKRAIGLVCTDSEDTRVYMQGDFHLAVGMEVWRGARTGKWRGGYENLAIFQIDGFDDTAKAGGSRGGGGYISNAYYMQKYGPGGTPWADIGAFQTQYGSTPLPADNYVVDNEPAYDIPNSSRHIVYAAVAMFVSNNAAGFAAVPEAARVFTQLRNRGNRYKPPNDTLPVVPGNYGRVSMTWAIVPVTT